MFHFCSLFVVFPLVRPRTPSVLIESKLVEAVSKYTAAIALRPTAIYLSNRAFCYLKLEQFELAIVDADLALT